MDEALYALLQSITEITDLVGDRVFPLIRPQDSEAPAIVYRKVSSFRLYDDDGQSDVTDQHYDLHIYARKYSTVQNLIEIINEHVSGLSGDFADMRIKYVSVNEVGNDDYIEDLELYTDSVEIEVEFSGIAVTGADQISPTVTNKSLSTSAVTASGFIVNFDKATDNETLQSNLVYKLYTSTSNNLGTEADTVVLNGTLQSTGTDVTSLTTSTVDPETLYYFNVVVEDEAGNQSVYTQNTETVPPDTTAPEVSNATLSTQSITSSSFDVTFAKATDNVTEQSGLVYKLYTSLNNDLDTDADTVILNGTLRATGTDVTLLSATGLDDGVTYYANIVVEDVAGNKTIYNSTSAQTTDVTAPSISNTTLSTANVGTTSFDVNYTEATDNTSDESTLVYRLYTSLSSNLGTSPANVEANGTLQDTGTNVSTLSVSGLNSTTTYYFNVVVEDEAGNKAIYNQGNVTTVADTTAPTVSNTTISTVDSYATGFSVTYQKATDDLSPQSALIYRLYTSTSNNLNTDADTVTTNGTFKDQGTDVNLLFATGLTEGTTYYFNIVVEDEAGNRAIYTANSVALAGDANELYYNEYSSSAFSDGTNLYNHGWTENWGDGVFELTDFGSLNNHQDQYERSGLQTVIGKKGEIRIVSGNYTFASLDELGSSPIVKTYNRFYLYDPFYQSRGGVVAFASTLNLDDGILVTFDSGSELLTITLRKNSSTVRQESFTKSGYTGGLITLKTEFNATTNTVSATISGAGITLSTHSITDNAVSEIYLTSDNKIGVTAHGGGMAINEIGFGLNGEEAPTNAVQADETDPTVSNTTLSTSNVSENSFNVDFTQATDDVSSQANLTYKLYSSDSNNLGTLSDILANGTLETSGSGVSTLEISGLGVGSTKYFNVIVEDQNGNQSIYTQNSETTQDVTSPTVATPSLSTSSLTETSFNVDFTKATDNVSQQTALVYKLYTSNSSNLNTDPSTVETNGTLADSGTDVNQLSVTGLTAGTLKYFNIVVEDEAGNKSIYTQNSQVTADNTSPTVSNTALTTSSVTENSFNVDYTKATDNVSDGTTLQYALYTSSTNDLTPDATSVITNGDLQDSGTDVATLIASGLTASTTYWFNVIVTDEAGNQSIYAQNSETTPDTSAPTVADSTLVPSNTTPNSFDVTFNKSTDNVSPQSALVYRLYTSLSDNLNSVANAEANGTLQDTGTDVSILSASGLSNETLYYYNVLVEDEAGNKAVYTANSLTTGDNTAPTVSNGTLTTSSVTSSGFNVDYAKASDNVSPQSALVYYLYTSTSDNLNTDASTVILNGTLQDSGTDVIQLTASLLDDGITYFFNVVVEDEAGNEEIYTSNSQQTTDATPPNVSTATLSTSTVLTDGFTVDYTQATDNGTSQANLAYSLYTSLSDNLNIDASTVETNGTLQATGTGVSQLSATGLNSGTTYYYNIVVADEAGNKSIYLANSVQTTDATDPVVSNSALSTTNLTESGFNVTYTEANDNITTQVNLVYRLYTSNTNNLDIDPATVETNGILVDTGTGVSTLSVTGLNIGDTKYFNVVVEDEAGNKSIYTQNSETVPDQTSPTVGTPTLSTANVADTSFDVTFTKATDNYSAQSTLTYDLYTSTTDNLNTDPTTVIANGTFQQAGTDVTSLTASGLTAETTYYFNVIVTDEAGNQSIYTSNSQLTDTTGTTHFTDFSQYADGTNLLANGWTDRWGNLTSFTKQTNGSGIAVGRYDNANGTSFISFDEVAQSDVMKLQYTTTIESGPNFEMQFVIWGSSTSLDDYIYGGIVANESNGVEGIRYVTGHNGTQTSYNQKNYSDDRIAVGETWIVKLECNASTDTMKIKAWKKGNAEPVDWWIDETNTNISDVYDNSQDKLTGLLQPSNDMWDIEYFSVGADGAEALTP